MYNMFLSDTQKSIKALAQRIAEETLIPNSIEIDKQHRFPSENMGKIAQAGLLGMVVPARYGGSESDSISMVLAAEEISRGCASTGLVFLAHTVGTLGMVLGATDAVKDRFLPPLARGEKLVVMAHTEPNSGVNNMAIQTIARPENAGFIINGDKCFITAAEYAEVFVVWAKTLTSSEALSLSMFIVQKGSPGFAIGRKNEMLGLRGSCEGELILRQCEVPAENLVGEIGGALKIATGYRDLAMLLAASVSLGIAGAALEEAIKYCKERVINGVPIGSHQGIQFYIADMATELKAAQALTYMAAKMKDDAPTEATIPALMAKAFASEMAKRLTDKALQIHGGHGYTEEFSLERHLRDARGMTLHVNTTEILKDSLGKMLISTT